LNDVSGEGFWGNCEKLFFPFLKLKKIRIELEICIPIAILFVHLVVFQKGKKGGETGNTLIVARTTYAISQRPAE